MIETFWLEFCHSKQLKNISMPEAWMFGDGVDTEMADELVNLVLAEKKRGTCSVFDFYKMNKETLPQIGQFDIILNGQGEPVAIIQIKKIELVQMDSIGEEFALSEGEGDLTYKYWYDEHKKFFMNEAESLGVEFNTQMELICENFEVVYRMGESKITLL